MKHLAAAFLLSAGALAAHGSADDLYKQGLAAYKTDPVRAYSLFVQAAEEGNVSAMAGAGHCLEHGTGTEPDYTQAISWYEKAVEENNLKACEGLARIYASCPDPQLHDGEQAVKYAEALVRKRPRDPEALALLARAYARNADFEKAADAGRKAMRYATRARETADYQQLLEQLGQGEPYPSIASDEWLVRAAGVHSRWAVQCLARRSLNHIEPSLEVSQAIRLCKLGIEEGDIQLYVVLGNLYLDAGEFDQAYDALQALLTAWNEQDPKPHGGLPVEVTMRGALKLTADQAYEQALIYRSERESVEIRGTYDTWDIIPYHVAPVADMTGVPFGRSFSSKEEAMRAYPQWDGSAAHFTYESRTMEKIKKYKATVSYRKLPPDLSATFYLLRIAAGKGSGAAGKELAEMQESLQQYLAVLENEGGHGPEIQAGLIEDEVLKHCGREEYPVNPELMEELLLKSYALRPSPRTACMLGMLNLRDSMDRRDYLFRYPDRGIGWLEVAHHAGYAPATRRLIELYACDQDPDLLDGNRAVEYAEVLVETSPPDDHDALQLLACAYAENKEFSKAEHVMKQALDLQLEAGGDPGIYRSQLAAFGKMRPWKSYSRSKPGSFAEIILQLNRE